jgi:hypothetical protein
MMPVPSHLRGVLTPGVADLDESPLIGRLSCGCGSRPEEFEIFYPGETVLREGDRYPVEIEVPGSRFFRIVARCGECGREHLLFDRDLHGLAALTGKRRAEAPRAIPDMLPWRCTRCGSTRHAATLEVESPGRQEVLSAAGEGFDPERWPDAFSRIGMSLRCLQCGKVTEDWVSCRTV